MPLHLVLHHRRAREQPWSNAWEDDDRIRAITTTDEVGDLCTAAMKRNEEIFIHRCAWSGGEPVVCCAAKIASVDQMPQREAFVRFHKTRQLHVLPTERPRAGQNFYEAAAPRT
jgi:hypothetical protein